MTRHSCVPLAAASYDRSYYPAGVPRQLAAMILDGSRAEALTTLDVPTLVIHGLDDTLIDPSGGRRTAELVPGARLLLVEDMGHDRPAGAVAAPGRRDHRAHRHQLTPSRGAFSTYPSAWADMTTNPGHSHTSRSGATRPRHLAIPAL